MAKKGGNSGGAKGKKGGGGGGKGKKPAAKVHKNKKPSAKVAKQQSKAIAAQQQRKQSSSNSNTNAKASKGSGASSSGGGAKASAGSRLSQMQEEMRRRLDGGKFRMLNEQLYTSTGDKAFSTFQSDPELFDVVRLAGACSHHVIALRPVHLRWRLDTTCCVCVYGCSTTRAFARWRTSGP